MVHIQYLMVCIYIYIYIIIYIYIYIYINNIHIYIYMYIYIYIFMGLSIVMGVRNSWMVLFHGKSTPTVREPPYFWGGMTIQLYQL